MSKFLVMVAIESDCLTPLEAARDLRQTVIDQPDLMYEVQDMETKESFTLSVQED